MEHEYTFVSAMYPDSAGREHMRAYAQTFLTRSKAAVLIEVQKDGELYLYKFSIRDLKK